MRRSYRDKPMAGSQSYLVGDQWGFPVLKTWYPQHTSTSPDIWNDFEDRQRRRDCL